MTLTLTTRLISAAEGGPREAAQCLAVFIAVDDSGVPVPVPVWTPETVLDQRLQQVARRRVSVRAEIDAALAVLRDSDAAADLEWAQSIRDRIAGG